MCHRRIFPPAFCKYVHMCFLFFQHPVILIAKINNSWKPNFSIFSFLLLLFLTDGAAWSSFKRLGRLV